VHEGDASSTTIGEPGNQAHSRLVEILEGVEVDGDTDDIRKPHGPLGHEEAMANQVAHELYPEARDAESSNLSFVTANFISIDQSRFASKRFCLSLETETNWVHAPIWEVGRLRLT